MVSGLKLLGLRVTDIGRIALGCIGPSGLSRFFCGRNRGLRPRQRVCQPFGLKTAECWNSCKWLFGMKQVGLVREGYWVGCAGMYRPFGPFALFLWSKPGPSTPAKDVTALRD